MPLAERHPISGPNLNEVRISGSFAPAGGGAPTAALGRGYTVARVGVGQFRVTFSDKYPRLKAFLHSLRTVDGIAPVGNYTRGGQYSAANKTIDVWTLQEGAAGAATVAVDLAANADNVVSFEAVFHNDTVE